MFARVLFGEYLLMLVYTICTQEARGAFDRAVLCWLPGNDFSLLELRARDDYRSGSRVDAATMQTMAEIALPSTFTSGGLASLVSSTQACRFEVAEFFVSWQGVLTVAYTGFPDALLQVRDYLFHLDFNAFPLLVFMIALALCEWQLRAVVVLWDIACKGVWRSCLWCCWLAQKPDCGLLPWFSEGVSRI